MASDWWDDSFISDLSTNDCMHNKWLKMGWDETDLLREAGCCCCCSPPASPLPPSHSKCCCCCCLLFETIPPYCLRYISSRPRLLLESPAASLSVPFQQKEIKDNNLIYYQIALRITWKDTNELRPSQNSYFKLFVSLKKKKKVEAKSNTISCCK